MIDTRYGKREFAILRKIDAENIASFFQDEILSLVARFKKAGHVDIIARDAKIIAKVVERLCIDEPLSLLTGEESEWENISAADAISPLWQNNRAQFIFKNAWGAYNIEAVKFRDIGNYGTEFAGQVEEITSALYIKEFPYYPRTFYIDVSRTGDGMELVDRSQLDAVRLVYVVPDAAQEDVA